jgi:RHS repeat-associated protein
MGTDNMGRMNQHYVGGGLKRYFGYDALGRMDSVKFKSAETTCSFTLGNGYRCDWSAYDSLETLSHDALGNLTARSSPSAGFYTYGLAGAYDTTAGNRIQSFGGSVSWGQSASCSYTIDSTGNVTQRTCSGSLAPPSASFKWSGDERLTSIVLGSGPTIGFVYDATGRLVRRDSAGVSTFFLWNGGDLFAELGSGGTSKRAEFDYLGTDSPHAIIRDSLPFYAHIDAFGNVRGLTYQGVQYRGYVYDEWGHQLVGAVADTIFRGADRPRFKGALWMSPEADLYYMRNRWYEPWTGRFLSEDPSGIGGGLNQYAYAAGDPINSADPTGLCREVWMNYNGVSWGYHLEDDAKGSCSTALTAGEAAERMFLYSGCTGQNQPTPNGCWDSYSEADYPEAATLASTPTLLAPTGSSCVYEAAKFVAAFTADAMTMLSLGPLFRAGGLGLVRLGTGALEHLAASSVGEMGLQTAGRLNSLRLSSAAALAEMSRGSAQAGLAGAHALNSLAAQENASSGWSASDGPRSIIDLVLFTPSAYRDYKACLDREQ